MAADECRGNELGERVTSVTDGVPDYGQACILAHDAAKYAVRACNMSAVSSQAFRTYIDNVSHPAFDSAEAAMQSVVNAGEAARCVLLGQYDQVFPFVKAAQRLMEKAVTAHSVAINAQISAAREKEKEDEIDG